MNTVLTRIVGFIFLVGTGCGAWAADVDIDLEQCDSVADPIYAVTAGCKCDYLVTNVTKSATTIDFDAVMEDSCVDGTLHVYVSDSPTAPSRTDHVAGTGATVYSTQAISGASTESISITGLSAETAYYVYPRYVTNRSALTNSIEREDKDFSETTDADPMGGGGTEEITGANQYFISDSSGNDSNDGTSPANAWQTLSHAVSQLDARSDSPDLWLLSGDVWYLQQLANIDWTGTSSDFAIVGCYKVDGSTPIRCDDTDTKPIIRGSFDDADRAEGRNGYHFGGPGSTVTGKVPSSIFGGMIVTQDSIRDHYLWIENLRVEDSAGEGIIIGSHTSHIAIVDVEVYYTGHLAINVRFGADDLLIMGGDFRFSAACQMWYEDRSSVDKAQVPDACENDYPSPIVTGDTSLRSFLVDNDVTHHWGEGIGAFSSDSAAVLGNRVRNVRRNMIYNADNQDTTIAYNIVWDSPEDIDWFERGDSFGPTQTGDGDYVGGDAYALNSETDLARAQDTTGNVFFNNVGVGQHGACFEQVTWSPPENVIEGEWVNNTCLSEQNTDYPVDFVTGAGHNNTSFNLLLRYKNNLVWMPDSNVSGCRASSYATRDFSHNMWDSTVQSSCDGTGNVESEDPQLSRSHTTFDSAFWTDEVGPTWADIAVTGGSALQGGTASHGVQMNGDMNTWFWWSYVEMCDQDDLNCWKPSDKVWADFRDLKIAADGSTITTYDIGAMATN